MKNNKSYVYEVVELRCAECGEVIVKCDDCGKAFKDNDDIFWNDDVEEHLCSNCINQE